MRNYQQIRSITAIPKGTTCKAKLCNLLLHKEHYHEGQVMFCYNSIPNVGQVMASNNHLFFLDPLLPKAYAYGMN